MARRAAARRGGAGARDAGGGAVAGAREARRRRRCAHRRGRRPRTARRATRGRSPSGARRRWRTRREARSWARSRASSRSRSAGTPRARTARACCGREAATRASTTAHGHRRRPARAASTGASTATRRARTSFGDAGVERARRRARPGAGARLLPASSLEGISCAACHSTVGPVAAHASRSRGYEGNATWTSPVTGATFLARPEDARGLPGIANSGYRLDSQLLLGGVQDGARVHPAPSGATDRYLASSEFCGACHDVRLFGTDVAGRAARRALQAPAQRVLRVARLGRRRGARGARAGDLPGLPHEPVPGEARPGRTRQRPRSAPLVERAPTRGDSSRTSSRASISRWPRSCPMRSSTIPRSTRTACPSASARGATCCCAHAFRLTLGDGAARRDDPRGPGHARERGRRSPRAGEASARSARPGWSCG